MDSTIVAAVISAIVSFLVAKLVSVSNKKLYLDNELSDIIKIAIQYPYLEDTEFTNLWEKNRENHDEKWRRYEQYCTLVFNYLEKFCKYYNYCKNKIENELDIKTWVRIHAQYWKNPTIPHENIDVYEDEFRKIVNDILA